jgi:hypothetical protein
MAAAEWLMDRKNRRAIPHRMERCHYVPSRNPDAEDTVKLGGKRQTVYTKEGLSPSEQLAAARKLATGR